MTDNDQNPYAVTVGMFNPNSQPTRRQRKLAELFIQNLNYHGGEAGVRNFIHYAEDCIAKNEIPRPRKDVEYFKYSGGRPEGHNFSEKISEVEIFHQTCVEFDDNKKESRQFTRRAFLQAAGVLGAGTAAIVAIKPSVKYLYSEKVSDRTRKTVGDAIDVGVPLVLTGLGGASCILLYALCTSFKDDLSEGPKGPSHDVGGFASKVQAMRAPDTMDR